MSVTHERCGHRHRPFTPCPHDAIDEHVDQDSALAVEEDERRSDWDWYRSGGQL